jgi:hypothetical protein
VEERILSLRRGRPTKYTKETARRVINYIKKCSQVNDFPTIEHLASVLGVGTRTLYEWKSCILVYLHPQNQLVGE